MYDLIILGGGPAGYHAAENASSAGLKTVLIEKGNLGGVCLNEGCISSKTILYSSRLFSQAKNSAAFGVSSENVDFDIKTVMTRKQKIIETMRKGVESTLLKNRVTIERGKGIIIPGESSLFRIQVGENVIEGKKLLICTGSEANSLPIPGVNQGFVCTSSEILDISVLPEKLTVIGAGAIGLELAAFFAETGCGVTVIEILPNIAGTLDIELGKILKREMEKKGVIFRLSSEVIEIGDHTVKFRSRDEERVIDTDIVLLSIGRKPVIDNIGLEDINILCENRTIVTDAKGRTNISGVWAAGDINGKSMLAHTAFREADVCINDMLGKEDIINYDAIPSVIYTHPEVACVGLTKEEAETRGFDTAVLKLPMSFNGRYLAETDGVRGICKVVIDRKTNRLLGAHIIGTACSEIIFGAANMIESKMKVEDIKKTVFPHPTVSEILKDTLLGYL